MEWIERKMKVKRTNYSDRKIQFGYNSYGHITIRVFDENKDDDMMIVLTAEESRELEMVFDRHGERRNFLPSTM